MERLFLALIEVQAKAAILKLMRGNLAGMISPREPRISNVVVIIHMILML
jgi:hypothetical protein